MIEADSHTSAPDSAYHHGDLRRALIESARRLLESEGLEALSLRKVAAAAGVSRSAPYHHFENKDALLAAVAAEGFRGLTRSMLSHSQKAGDPAGRLCGLGIGYVVYAVNNPALFRLMQGPYFSERSDYAELHEAAHSSYQELRKAIATRLQTGDEKQVELACAAAWSLVHGFATLCVDGRMGKQIDITDLETVAAEMTRQLDVTNILEQ